MGMSERHRRLHTSSRRRRSPGLDGRRGHHRQLRRAALRHRGRRRVIIRTLNADGIRPLESDGLWGIVWAPLLHADWEHLIANTGARRWCSASSCTLAGHVPLHLRDRDRLDPRRLRHLADRQHRRPHGVRDQPHRRVRADLRLADVPHRVRLLHPQGVADRRRDRRCCSSTAAFCSVRCPAPSGCRGRATCAAASRGVFAAYLLSGPERKAREKRKTGTAPQLSSDIGSNFAGVRCSPHSRRFEPPAAADVEPVAPSHRDGRMKLVAECCDVFAQSKIGHGKLVNVRITVLGCSGSVVGPDSPASGYLLTHPIRHRW